MKSWIRAFFATVLVFGFSVEAGAQEEGRCNQKILDPLLEQAKKDQMFVLRANVTDEFDPQLSGDRIKVRFALVPGANYAFYAAGPHMDFTATRLEFKRTSSISASYSLMNLPSRRLSFQPFVSPYRFSWNGSAGIVLARGTAEAIRRNSEDPRCIAFVIAADFNPEKLPSRLR